MAIKITPYEKNAKKHPKKQIEQVAASIKEFGMNQPIVVDKQGVIIVGHGRFEALKHLGWEIKDEYIKVVDLTEEQAKAYRLADNKLNESEWDMALVIEELKGLSDEMVELSGFDSDLIIEPEEKDDEVPDVPEEPQSQLGDLYELGEHRVLCGDSLDLEQVMRLANGRKADMYLTDPPYNVAHEGKTKDALTIQNDSMSNDDFRKFLVDAYTGADAIMKPGAVFYIWHADLEGYNFRGACFDYGWKEGASHLWTTDRKQTTVLQFDRPSRNAEHPTMKPVELFSYQITNNTKGEDIVFDNFLGSGTTLIAAEKTGRICYGMELDPKYVDVIVSRYCEYTGNTTIKKNGEEIIWQK